MSLLEKLLGRKPKTAAVARDRLQIIIAQERANRDAANGTPDYLPTLQKELLEVLSKYVDMLALNITLPENKKGQPAPEAGKTDKP